MNLENKLLNSLFKAALKAKDFSYSPYSNFKVGCALLTKEAKIISGCNVENIINGNSICAEQTAITKAVSLGYKNFQTIVVVTDLNNFVFPCGSCRQVISEFSPNCNVYVLKKDLTYKKFNITELLPSTFCKIHLQKNVLKK